MKLQRKRGRQVVFFQKGKKEPETVFSLLNHPSHQKEQEQKESYKYYNKIKASLYASDTSLVMSYPRIIIHGAKGAIDEEKRG